MRKDVCALEHGSWLICKLKRRCKSHFNWDDDESMILRRGFLWIALPKNSSPLEFLLPMIDITQSGSRFDSNFY